MADRHHRREPEEIISELEYHNPVDRYAQLPEPTRQWLEGLRPEDIQDLNEGRKLLHSTRTLGRFGKWLAITVFSIFLVISQTGEALQKVWRFIFYGVHGP